MRKTHNVALLGILTAFALILHLIEAQIPVLVSVPGIKLGLANVTSLLCLYLFGFPQSLAVLLLRCLIGSFFSGQLIGFVYSITGGILSLVVMFLTKKRFSDRHIPLISIIGAVFHNIGQVAAAILITGTPGIIIYLPFLLISGMIAGWVIGLLVYWCLPRIKKVIK